jgi:hypothetical protein
MRRRRYLQTTALALTTGIAGCSEFAASWDNPASTETAEPTETASPTATAEPTPRDEPRNVDPPLYVDLLPRLQMKGPDGEGDFGSDNAVFTKVDWEWYLRMRETVPKFGPTGDEAWSFRPSDGNFTRAPSADILKSPVYGTLTATNLLEGELSLNFGNLSPVLLEQLGLQADEGEREAARVIDEAILSYQPRVGYFAGVDTGQVRAALEENTVVSENPEKETTLYESVREDGSAGSRGIFVSDNWERGVVAIQAANYDAKQLAPVGARIAGFGDSSPPATEIESVQWCLDELVDAPVVTAEINGARRKFGVNPHGDRGIEPIEPFDTLMFGMDVSEYAGTVQAIVSAVDGGAPTPDALRDAFEEDTGTYGTTFHPNVSTISGSW